MDSVHAKNNFEIQKPSYEKLNVFVKAIQSVLLHTVFFAVSTIVPLVLFLIYRNYATQAGIVLKSGCDGPELPFGMLSGFFMWLQLRFISLGPK